MNVREKTIDPEKVAIYIRWSTDDQSDGTTLEVQSEGCRHYLLSQGWAVNEDLIFVDDGWSGGTLDRPGLTRLRALVKRGLVDCVVVFKLDRLSRSVIDMVNLVLEEWEGLTHVKSAREPLDTSSAIGKQFFYMLVSFAEWERNVIRERTVSGRYARVKEGYKPSAKAPFGYRHGTRTGSLEVDEAEASIVRRIFDLYINGMGAQAIASHLNTEGVRPRSGAHWSVRTTLYLLSNPIYIGKVVYGRSSFNPRHGKAEGEPRRIKHEAPVVVEKSEFIPPLIPEDVFALVQRLKTERYRKPGRSPRSLTSEYLLSGVARCQKCGHQLYARVRKKYRKEYRAYCCSGHRLRGTACCDGITVPQTLLEDRLAQEIISRYGDQVAREEYRQSVMANLDREAAEVQAAVQQLELRLNKFEAEQKRIRLDYREQLITAAEYRELKQDLDKDLADGRALRQQLQVRKAEVEDRRQALSVQNQALDQLDTWETLEIYERKNLVRHFIESIEVFAERGSREIEINIVWK